MYTIPVNGGAEKRLTCLLYTSVAKFGGTSVASPERIKNVAKRLVGMRQRGDEVVAVVLSLIHISRRCSASAWAGSTTSSSGGCAGM